MFSRGLISPVAVFVILLLAFVPTFTQSFSVTKHQEQNVIGGSRIIQSTQLYQSSSPEEDGKKQSRINNKKFLEESSKSGYDKVKAMSIEERTRRAMLAEAAEDRIVMLSDELEKLLGDDGMPLKVEDREEVTILATQIKASREQYKTLVNGGEVKSFEMFDLSSSTEDDENIMDFQ